MIPYQFASVQPTRGVKNRKARFEKDPEPRVFPYENLSAGLEPSKKIKPG